MSADKEAELLAEMGQLRKQLADLQQKSTVSTPPSTVIVKDDAETKRLQAEVNRLNAQIADLTARLESMKKATTPPPAPPVVTSPVISSQSSSTVSAANSGQVVLQSYQDVRERYGLENIYFDHNSSVIKPDEESKLRRTAAILQRYGQSRLIIKGFADKTGNADYNLRLSKLRADAVKNWLIQNKSVAPEQVVISYVGDTSDDAPGNNPNARRVELSLE